MGIPSNSQNMEYLHFSPLQESFHSLEKWLFALESYSDDTYIVIVANKCDLDFVVPVEVSSIWATLTPEILDTRIQLGDSLHLPVKSMQRSGTEAIRTKIQPSKPKREITIITHNQNTKRTYGQPSCFSKGGHSATELKII